MKTKQKKTIKRQRWVLVDENGRMIFDRLGINNTWVFEEKWIAEDNFKRLCRMYTPDKFVNWKIVICTITYEVEQLH